MKIVSGGGVAVDKDAFAGPERLTQDLCDAWRIIFVGSKAPWFEITDDLPQFEEHAH